MTWPRYLEVCEYWQSVPPLAETVAGLMGGTKSPRSRAAPGGEADGEALIAELMGAGITIPPELVHSAASSAVPMTPAPMSELPDHG